MPSATGTTSRVSLIAIPYEVHVGQLSHVLREPVQQQIRDFPAVLLQHQHVTIAVKSGISQPGPGGMNSGLFEELHGAVIVPGMVGSLGSNDEDGHLLQIRKEARGRILKPASSEVRIIRLLFPPYGKIGRTLSRRLVRPSLRGRPPSQ